MNIMNAVTFDTLKFTRKLKAGGFTQEQAETAADAFAEAVEDRLATKHDVELLRRDIVNMEAKLGGEVRLNRWMLGIVIAAVVLPLIRDFLL
ncbi:MAG: DUF1640 domain-containing protein [Alphaproteobacteria bacterium]